MQDERILHQADEAYGVLLGMLDGGGWRYAKDAPSRSVEFAVKGGSGPIALRLVIEASMQLILVYSPLSFRFGEERRVDGAVALNAVNCQLSYGSFDLDLSTGAVVFRLSSSIRRSIPSPQLYEALIAAACATVDKYAQQLLRFSKGEIAFPDLYRWINS